MGFVQRMQPIYMVGIQQATALHPRAEAVPALTALLCPDWILLAQVEDFAQRVLRCAAETEQAMHGLRLAMQSPHGLWVLDAVLQVCT